jgi:hypothetical protein
MLSTLTSPQRTAVGYRIARAMVEIIKCDANYALNLIFSIKQD